MDYLKKNNEFHVPELKAHWEKNEFKPNGTWEEIFVKGEHCDEIFMAWYYARYANKAAESGKKEYLIPMYANAWLDRKKNENYVCNTRRQNLRFILVNTTIYKFAAFVKAQNVNLTGSWRADIETQIRLLKYTYVFSHDGNIVTGKSKADINGEKYETEIKDGKVKGDSLFIFYLKLFQNPSY
jgi:hypothetical protein